MNIDPEERLNAALAQLASERQENALLRQKVNYLTHQVDYMTTLERALESQKKIIDGLSTTVQGFEKKVQELLHPDPARRLCVDPDLHSDDCACGGYGPARL